MNQLFGTNVVPTLFTARIGFQVHAPKVDSHFPRVNLLGMDFCAHLDSSEIFFDFAKRTTTMRLNTDDLSMAIVSTFMDP
jgi:hypothetical protein